MSEPKPKAPRSARPLGKSLPGLSGRKVYYSSFSKILIAIANTGAFVEISLDAHFSCAGLCDFLRVF